MEINPWVAFIGGLLLGIAGIHGLPMILHLASSPTVATSTSTDGSALAIPCSVRHLALIMDGNRRWAKQQGLPTWQGHQAGIGPLKEAVRLCLDLQIPYLTVYAFSLENFKRSPEELEYLFNTVARQAFVSDLQTLAEHGVQIRVAGDRSRFPVSLKDLIIETEEATRSGTRLVLTILFSYGGQQELAAATQEIALKCTKGTLDPSTITIETLAQHLWTGDIPAPDLIIRTGGQQRLSNCLAFQSAYAELSFLDKYWPAVTRADLEQELSRFERRARNFGA